MGVDASAERVDWLLSCPELPRVAADRDAIAASIEAMVETVQTYAPGAEPQFDDPRPDWNGLARLASFLHTEVLEMTATAIRAALVRPSTKGTA